MRKIALFAAVAILAASCNSDELFFENAAENPQSDGNGMQAKVNDIINNASKSISESEWEDLRLSINAYSNFADLLINGDYADITSRQFGNIITPNADTTGINIDLSKIRGSYSFDRGDWDYKPATPANELQFRFNTDGDSCVIAAEIDTVNVREARSESSFVRLFIPEHFKDTLFVEGERVCWGSTDAKIDSDNDFYGFNIDRHFGSIGFMLNVMSDGRASIGNPETASKLVVFDANDEESFALSYKEIVGDEDIFSWAIGGPNDFVRFEGETFDMLELVEILALNKTLAESGHNPDIPFYEDVMSRISKFNSNNSMTFSYIDDPTEYIGKVKLELYEPDEDFDFYHIDLCIKYNDGNEWWIVNAPIEEMVISVRDFILSVIAAGIIEAVNITESVISGYVDAFVGFANAVINAGIENARQACELVAFSVIYTVSAINSGVQMTISEIDRFVSGIRSIVGDFNIGIAQEIAQYWISIYNLLFGPRG